MRKRVSRGTQRPSSQARIETEASITRHGADFHLSASTNNITVIWHPGNGSPPFRDLQRYPLDKIQEVYRSRRLPSTTNTSKSSAVRCCRQVL
jgi:hypothetical protein